MDKQSLFVQVANLEERIGELYVELGTLKQKIQDLIEENQRLERENEHFQQESLGKQSVHEPGSAQDNLLRIYREGFHICNVKYGSLRTEGECLFCLSFIQKT
ncbi:MULTISPECIES: initiation-control protein YabA [Alicyclobacillus]|uniref:DNA replication initiation control protein YabA n=1 Tax=Alicyclobacillus acidoterrestris (strain ATCC 49025 / DSM 3922 / CIP 106132 / NCIMB 13137 / GD3B) TaxID=1356854 RepID=T0CL27_ALIAG|nr:MULTISPECIES: DNA replication initiation control protein YabA [Alicyclobacillus]EPZ53215.1 DNA replication initiation control protein YabA [Alicyclobacillus acidoterrestris ATCC 49025]UNO49217.1 DNA replication initiation control protein YabA [Alicyclobacillus acidoterrestris]GEO26365.1 initiation-control protein YabA [Alicyclobacillus acidoterrestris]